MPRSPRIASARFACALGVLGATLIIACETPTPPRAQPQQVVTTPDRSARGRFIDDAAFRRAALEASLENPDNDYSRDRLVAYGIDDAGWELLPQWNPRSVPVGPTERATLVRGAAPVLPPATHALWDGKLPSDDAGWLALGRRVFYDYPLRADDTVAFAIADPRRAAAFGLVAADDGAYPGVVLFEDVDGRDRVGITCAVCHAALHEGRPWPGLAHRDLDLGAMRLAYHDATGEPLADELAARMRRWGPGRADITGDDDEDPVAIPDLWRLLELDALTQAGTLRLGAADEGDESARRDHDLVVLAIRQETQIIQANGERVRPPRVLAWALARFVAELDPPPRVPPSALGVRAGLAVFNRECRRCHHGPAHSGAPVDADTIGTHPALARSRARGTGKLRPAPLLDVSMAAPYFHDGSVPTLAEVLGVARMRPDYTGGVRGQGPQPGHAFGTALPESERAALLAYLATL